MVDMEMKNGILTAIKQLLLQFSHPCAIHSSIKHSFNYAN